MADRVAHVAGQKAGVSNNVFGICCPPMVERLRTQAARSENPYLLTVLEVAVGTGMRYSEIMTLRWRNIMLRATRRPGAARTDQNSEPRGVPLAGKAFETVLALRDAHKKANHGKVNSARFLLFPSTRTRIVQCSCANLGKPRWNVQASSISASTTCATGLSGDGGPQRPQKSLKCWATRTLQMVKRYAHLSKLPHFQGAGKDAPVTAWRCTYEAEGGGRWHGPDWTKPESYPKTPRAWSYRVWAWEFLRRNPEFQRQCDELAKTSAGAKQRIARVGG